MTSGKNRKKGEGICKLTKKHGTFVSSHLIPKALTKPEESGRPFVETWSGKRPKRTWSSWYDNQLVTAEGEAILSAIDGWAITELRKHKLVWSGWGPMQTLGNNHDLFGDSGFGLRSISGLDGKRLRLFFLSLLWRAAASTHHSFLEVRLLPEQIEKLGEMLLTGNSEPPSYFAVHLTQISTIGIVHNLSPLSQAKTLRYLEEERAERTVPFFRFYFDGLIAHVHHNSEGELATEAGPLVLGLQEKLVVPTITFDESYQRKNLANLMLDAFADWPDEMKRLLLSENRRSSDLNPSS
jgi:hypothetical protein